MRTGSEPTTARSALRMRFWLSVWGVIWAVFGTVAFAAAGRLGWSLACGLLLLAIVADLVVVVRRIRRRRREPGRRPDRYGRPPR
jgi:membrane protein implicated in regulation of membrane protease activity